ncbi:MAG: PCC domain-containing protein [Anaerolineae bacterium]|jgi:predicted DNA-binding protein with PD1-like motif|nr:DNA-binding protein [Chloroflexota bacterium]
MQLHKASGPTRAYLLVLERGDDVIACVRQVLEQVGGQTGLVTAGVGSFSVLKMHTITTAEPPSKDLYMDAAGPIEVGSMLGSIIGGEPHIHLVAHHTADDRTYIGHLEPGTLVAFRAELGLLLWD